MRPEDVVRIRSEEPADLWPEIERRLSVPGPRARRRIGRVPTIVAGVLVASVFTWAVFALSGLPGKHGSSQPAGGIARIGVPEPQPLVAGEGSVWVVGSAGSNDGELWRIDPATNQATLIPGTLGAFWPAVGEGAAWVTTCRSVGMDDCSYNDLLRIDPSSNAVTSSLRLPGIAWAITAGLGSVWVSSTVGLLRIDPQSMSVVGTFPLRATNLGIADGYVWATMQGGGGGVGKIDPVSGKVLAQISFHDPCTFSASDQEVLVASCQGGLPPGTGPDHLAGIDPSTAKLRFNVPLSAYGQLAFTEGHPWIATWATDQRRVQVQQLDPATGLPTGVNVWVHPGSIPWMDVGPGSPAVFIGVEDGSLWLTHVDANDVVRVDIPSA